MYSGVGGWALGLRLAGIKTAGSYEWWGPANDTYRRNFQAEPHEADIRELGNDKLPQGIELVVGSPPCNQFSYSNRGGGGDIDDGLKDVRRFLEIVEYLSPDFWVMENVPRLSKILENELSRGGSLARFAPLVDVVTVVEMSSFGLPQRRKRMLAGKFPLSLLESYGARCSPMTLGQVVSSLRDDPVVDPTYGLIVPAAKVSDHQPERRLDTEELRMNRESKEYHPVYNVMQFPDPLDRSSRTVTATCTRVSRESIVIEDSGRPNEYRRLTVRERACLQGFPISFQFHADSYTSKLKLVGNAFPPPMAYYLAEAIKGTSAANVKLPSAAAGVLPTQLEQASDSLVDSRRRTFSPHRRFRAALPSLRFGSGVRFELANEYQDDQVRWALSFYCGTSKRIVTVDLNQTLLLSCREILKSSGRWDQATEILERLQAGVDGAPERLQLVWSHRADDRHPFAVVDALGVAADELSSLIEDAPSGPIIDLISNVLRQSAGGIALNGSSRQLHKLLANHGHVFGGLLLGAWFNTSLQLSSPSQIPVS